MFAVLTLNCKLPETEDLSDEENGGIDTRL